MVGCYNFTSLRNVRSIQTSRVRRLVRSVVPKHSQLRVERKRDPYTRS